ncbi:MAG: DnaJ domain-containing protein [Campylobacterales bacterium]|nr:DnaJ domain-containing protein [Campylobacterales bacterium]
MHLEVKSKWVVLTLHEDSVQYKIAKRFIENNFSKIVSLQNSILVFNIPDEKQRRAIFLNWIATTYLKYKNLTSSTFSKELQSKIDYCIKIKIISSNNAVIESVNIYLKTINTNKIFLYIKNNKFLFTYFKSLFKKNIVKIDINNLKMIFSINNIEDFENFDKIIKRTKILNYNTSFIYNKDEFNLLYEQFEKYEEDTESIKKLVEYYTLLNSNENDSFEDIKIKYKELIKKYHPDRVYGHDEYTVNLYTEKFRNIQEAFENIKKVKVA